MKNILKNTKPFPGWLIMIAFVTLAGCVTATQNQVAPPWTNKTLTPPFTATMKPTKTAAPPTVTGMPNLDCGLLSGDPCGPPCFWGIIPGETTEESALKILETRIPLSACLHYDYSESGGTRGIQCSNTLFTEYDKDVGLSFDDGFVIDVGFSTPRSITIDQIVRQYGGPALVLLSPVGISYPEKPSDKTMAILYFSRVRMAIHMPTKVGFTYEILPNDRIEYVIYKSTDEYKSATQCASNPWHGYGEYSYSSTICP